LIKNVVFDFGGVLVDWNPEYLFKDVFSSHAEMDHFLENVCNSDWNEQQDAGRSITDAIRTQQERYPQYREEIRMYYDQWTTMLGGAIEQNVALLEPLKTRYRLFGLTNWSTETFPIAWDMYPFFRTFEGIVISGEEKLKKPDVRIYRVLLERYGLVAGESLFIDDSEANVQSAELLGFQGIHLVDGLNLKDALIRRGVNGLS
jgi:2-haloacid dehalogenase